MTRMKKMQNHCQGRFPNFDIDEICRDDEEQDTIEIDIDTQQIMVTRVHDDGNDVYKCDNAQDQQVATKSALKPLYHS